MIQEYSNTVDFNRLSSVKSFVDDFHMHNFYELFILLKGELSFLIQNSRYEITAGTLLFVNDTEIHRSINRLKQPYERIYIHIPPAFFPATQRTKSICAPASKTGSRESII